MKGKICEKKKSLSLVVDIIVCDCLVEGQSNELGIRNQRTPGFSHTFESEERLYRQPCQYVVDDDIMRKACNHSLISV